MADPATPSPSVAASPSLASGGHLRAPSTSIEAFKKLSEPGGGNLFINNTWRVPLVKLLRMVLVGAVLVPIRLTLTIINLLFLVLIANSGTAFMTRRDLQHPLPLWRRIVLFPLRYLLRVQLFLLGYHWITVNGRPASKSQANLVTPNHITFVEPVFLMYYIGGTPVSAIENASLPIIGSIFKAVQTMFVERDRSKRPGNAPGASQSTPSIQELITQRASDMRFPQVLIFPEGTCTNGSAVISFKTGAFNPGLPVQPVAIKYFYRHFDPSWVSGGPNVYVLMLRMMCQVHNYMEVNFLPVHTPSPSERADPRIFAWNVQRNIALALKVRTTQHSYEDILLAAIARKARYPVERAVVEFQAMRRVLDIDPKTASAYLQRFMQLDRQKTGRITYEQFRELFASAKIDHEHDVHGAGEIKHSAISNASTVAAPSAEGNRSPSESIGSVAALSPPRYTTETERTIKRTFSIGMAEEDAELAPVATATGDVVGAEEELMRLFELLDIDEDGALDFRELLFGLSVMNDRGAKHSIDTFSLAFRLLDTDRKGKISCNQLERALRRVWPDLPPEKMNAIFAEADADHDGMVSSAEFIRWATSHQEHLPLFRETFFGFKDELDLLPGLIAANTKAMPAAAVEMKPAAAAAK